jgi:hypothetical protein
MENDDSTLRILLVDISNKLSNDNRASLGFLLRDDVPRRELDIIARDNRAPMNPIWDELINRQKITADNVDYLIACFEQIHRIDLARQLRQYSQKTSLRNRVEQPARSSNIFNRIDP